MTRLCKKILILIILVQFMTCVLILQAFASINDMQNDMPDVKAEAEADTEADIVETEIKEVDYYPLTKEERDYLYGVIAAELRGGSEEGMTMIAECIRDRALNGHYGKDIMAVMTAKAQFAAPYTGVLHPNAEINNRVDQRINNAIDAVFVEGVYLFDEPILHFHATWIEAPSWTKNLKELARLDKVVFYN